MRLIWLGVLIVLGGCSCEDQCGGSGMLTASDAHIRVWFSGYTSETYRGLLRGLPIGRVDDESGVKILGLPSFERVVGPTSSSFQPQSGEWLHLIKRSGKTPKTDRFLQSIWVSQAPMERGELLLQDVVGDVRDYQYLRQIGAVLVIAKLGIGVGATYELAAYAVKDGSKRVLLCGDKVLHSLGASSCGTSVAVTRIPGFGSSVGGECLLIDTRSGTVLQSVPATQSVLSGDGKVLVEYRGGELRLSRVGLGGQWEAVLAREIERPTEMVFDSGASLLCLVWRGKFSSVGDCIKVLSTADFTLMLDVTSVHAQNPKIEHLD